MSTRAHSESTGFVSTQMARVARFFSGSQVKECTRLEAEVSLIRKRLSTHMPLLPIVQSTDTGGLACAFVFSAARGYPHSSTTIAPPPVAVSHDAEEVNIVEVGQRARTEDPQDGVSPGAIKEAHGRTFIDRDFSITGEEDEEDDDWFGFEGVEGEGLVRDRAEEIEGRTLGERRAMENTAKSERAGIG